MLKFRIAMIVCSLASAAAFGQTLPKYEIHELDYYDVNGPLRRYVAALIDRSSNELRFCVVEIGGQGEAHRKDCITFKGATGLPLTINLANLSVSNKILRSSGQITNIPPNNFLWFVDPNGKVTFCIFEVTGCIDLINR